MKTFKQFLTESGKRRRYIDRYVYHGSPSSNHDSIKQNGLEPRHPFPGYPKKLVFFHVDPEGADHYTRGDGYQYRVHKSKLPKDTINDYTNGHLLSPKGVEPKHIRYRRAGSKRWKRLNR